MEEDIGDLEQKRRDKINPTRRSFAHDGGFTTLRYLFRDKLYPE